MKTKSFGIITAFAFAAIHTVSAQGSLTPPAGPPAPVMKTLDQVEARIPLVAGAADSASVLTSDPDYQFAIVQPGSYYLTGNLSVTKTHGIDIRAAGVTLDLNGFVITRPGAGPGTGYGIHITPTSHGAAVCNGTIERMDYGIYNSDTNNKGCAITGLVAMNCVTCGIQAASSATVRNCRTIQCGNGIQCQVNSVIDGCTVSGSTLQFGIVASASSTLNACKVEKSTLTIATTRAIWTGGASVLRDCSVSNCKVFNGIDAAPGSTLQNCTVITTECVAGISAQDSVISHCTAAWNSGTTTWSGGINAQECVVEHCNAYSNSSNLTGSATAGYGINAGSSRVSNCLASSNDGSGIIANNTCLVTGNISKSNAANGTGAGIHVRFGDSRIQDNNVIGGAIGIQVEDSGNWITGNTVSNCTKNFEIVANNKVGTIVAAPNSGAISGSTGGAGMGSTNPWDNFSF